MRINLKYVFLSTGSRKAAYVSNLGAIYICSTRWEPSTNPYSDWHKTKTDIRLVAL